MVGAARTRRSRRAIGACVVVAALATPSGVNAESAPEAVRLVYEAPPLCPTSADFVAEVARSLPDLRIDAGAARRFHVVIAPDGRAGSLTLDDGGAGRREVQAPDCLRVSRLLAFATALAIDPSALSSAPDEPPEAVAPLAVRPLEADAPAPHAQRRMRASLGAFARVQSAAAPQVTVGAGLSGLVSLASARLEPALALGAAYASGAPTEVERSRVTFQTLVGLLELCPATLRRSSLAVRPCVRGEGGLRLTTGHDVPAARRARRPWLAVGLTAHVRWQPGRRWFGELGAGALFPLVRDRVVLTPDTTVHRTPAAGVLGEIAVGLELGDQGAD
jgi:hypothetical protein